MSRPKPHGRAGELLKSHLEGARRRPARTLQIGTAHAGVYTGTAVVVRAAKSNRNNGCNTIITPNSRDIVGGGGSKSLLIRRFDQIRTEYKRRVDTTFGDDPTPLLQFNDSIAPHIYFFSLSLSEANLNIRSPRDTTRT